MGGVGACTRPEAARLGRRLQRSLQGTSPLTSQPPHLALPREDLHRAVAQRHQQGLGVPAQISNAHGPIVQVHAAGSGGGMAAEGSLVQRGGLLASDTTRGAARGTPLTAAPQAQPHTYLCDRYTLTRRTSEPSGRRHSASLDTLTAYSCRWLPAVCGADGQGGADGQAAGVQRRRRHTQGPAGRVRPLPCARTAPACAHRHRQHSLLWAPVRPHVGPLLPQCVWPAVQLAKLQPVLPAAPDLHRGGVQHHQVLARLQRVCRRGSSRLRHRVLARQLCAAAAAAAACLAAVDGLRIFRRGARQQRLGPAVGEIHGCKLASLPEAQLDSGSAPCKRRRRVAAAAAGGRQPAGAAGCWRTPGFFAAK